MKRQPHELQRPIDCDTSHAEFELIGMEEAARKGVKGNSRLISGKWLSVFFCNDSQSLVYDWQGGYPTSNVKRETVLSVLAHC